eukprot:Skav235156  [mRNA]  locus=scaffold1923:114352:116618:- [translate_table: standard]
MPSLARVLELVQSVLEGLIGVSVETHTEQGNQHLIVRVEPDLSPADEVSPASGPGTEAFSVIPASGIAPEYTAAANWWESQPPVHPGPHVLSLSSQLREGGELSCLDRIKLAYSRGRQGAQIYRGECSSFSGPRCTLRSRCYVVLRARHHQGTVTAEESSNPSHLFFQHGSEICQCLVVRKVDSGAVLCIPRDGVSGEVFAEAEETDYAGIIGPFSELSVRAATSSGALSRRSLDILLFDLDVAGFDGVLMALPPGTDAAACKDFGSYRGQQDWPHIPSLLDLCRQFVASGDARLEPYFTADEVEEVGPEAANPPGVRNGGTSMQDVLNQLLHQSSATQELVAGMQGQVAQFGSRLSVIEKQQSGPGAVGGWRDSPQLFSSAPPGLSEEKKEALRLLAARGPAKLGDLGVNGRAPLPVVTDPFGGTIEEEDPEDLDGQPLSVDPSANTLEKLLASQQRLLTHLVQAKTRQNDPLALLSAPTGDDADQPRGSGVKGIAARQMLQDSFRRHPQKVVALIHDRLATARRKASSSELEPRDMWYHFQESVPLGSHKTLTHVAFIAASMFEATQRNQLDRLQMLSLLLAVFVEQAAFDGGSLRLAHLLTGLEDPPFAQTELHKVPRSDLAHGALSDPKWVTTQLQFLKDIDSIQEKAGKYGRPAPHRPSEPADTTTASPKPKAKWRPRKGKKSQEAEPEDG